MAEQDCIVFIVDSVVLDTIPASDVDIDIIVFVCNMFEIKIQLESRLISSHPLYIMQKYTNLLNLSFEL